MGVIIGYSTYEKFFKSKIPIPLIPYFSDVPITHLGPRLEFVYGNLRWGVTTTSNLSPKLSSVVRLTIHITCMKNYTKSRKLLAIGHPYIQTSVLD